MLRTTTFLKVDWSAAAKVYKNVDAFTKKFASFGTELALLRYLESKNSSDWNSRDDHPQLDFLDVACGTGAATLGAMNSFVTKFPTAHKRPVASAADGNKVATMRITGADLSPGMLDQFRLAVAEQQQQQQQRQHTEFSALFKCELNDAVVADMSKDLEQQAVVAANGGKRFDAAACAFGLMFTPDKPAALQQMSNCLKSDAPLALLTWNDYSLFSVLARMRELLIADGLGSSDVGVASMSATPTSPQSLPDLEELKKMVLDNNNDFNPKKTRALHYSDAGPHLTFDTFTQAIRLAPPAAALGPVKDSAWPTDDKVVVKYARAAMAQLRQESDESKALLSLDKSEDEDMLVPLRGTACVVIAQKN